MIRDKIDNDQDGQVDIPLDYLGSFYKDHMYPVIDDIIKELTTHTDCQCDKGNCYVSYHNGYYYPNNDCYNAYKLEHCRGCISITSKVDTSDDDSDDGSDDDSDDEQYKEVCGHCITTLCKNTHIYSLTSKATTDGHLYNTHMKAGAYEMTICSDCYNDDIEEWESGWDVE